MERRPAIRKRLLDLSLLPGLLMTLAGRSLFSVLSNVVKGTMTGGVWVVKTAYEAAAGTGQGGGHPP